MVSKVETFRTFLFVLSLLELSVILSGQALAGHMAWHTVHRIFQSLQDNAIICKTFVTLLMLMLTVYFRTMFACCRMRMTAVLCLDLARRCLRASFDAGGDLWDIESLFRVGDASRHTGGGRLMLIARSHAL